MMDTSNQRGQLAEDQACQYLKAQGLKVLARNFRAKTGEIDIIMQEQDEIVFVEVRLRNNPHFSSAIESVDHFKQRKLIKTATYYLCQKNWLDKVNCRFDVIGISYAQTKVAIEWIKDAFPVDNF
jgi:putative endonuclease